MADTDNAIDQGCGCPGGDSPTTHDGTGAYIYGEAFCGDLLTMGCDQSTLVPRGREDVAKKLSCYLDQCCSFYDLVDTPEAGECPTKTILYNYIDPITGDKSVKCGDFCALLHDAVNNPAPCSCECECDDDCSCEPGCVNPRGDKLVGATPNDPNPGSLIEKLQNNSCGTWEVVNAGTDNERIQFNCTNEYNLIDTLDGPGQRPTCAIGNGNIVQDGQVGWKVVCPECIPIGTLRLTDSISEFAIESGIDGFVGLGGSRDNDMTSCSSIKNVNYDNGSNNGSFATGGAFQATLEGRYDLEFSVPMRWSHGIRTVRMQLTALPNSVNPGVIIEDTIEGPDFETADYENAFATNSAATNNSAVHGALVRGISRYTFSGSRMVYLYAGDCVSLIMKYSATDIDEEIHKDGTNFSIHGSNDNGVTNGSGPGAHISRHYVSSTRYPVL